MPLTVENQIELIPGYRLLERIGSGGFGEVWKAEAPGGFLKAVKIIHSNLSDMPGEVRLDQELKALHRVKTIRHPYILSLERFDIIKGRLIIVSELADCTLFDRLKECRAHGHVGIPRDELLGYMVETAEALDLMNGQFNLQHLDIKPQNIFLLFNHAKVGDFGLVKDLQGRFAAITSGVTALYAAPETFEGLVTRFCDQYNLAIAYQELLTGQLPFNGTTGRQLMMQHLTGVPNLSPLPPADQPVVARALSKKPEERFPSCGDFVRALAKGPSCVSLTGTAPDIAIAAAETAGEGARPLPPLSEEQTTSVTRRGGHSGDGHSSGGHVTPAEKAAVLAADPPMLVPAANELDRTPATRAPASHTPAKKQAAGKPAALVNHVPPAPPPERPELTGDGVLMPALVVGLGGLGTQVLQEFRKSLRNRAPAETWPNIRLLSVDTDAERYERAAREPDSVLNPEEMLVTSFQRLSHYVKRQHEREELERWLPLNQLMHVPRGQATAEGWRALGRLALVSSVPVLTARLRHELEACTSEKSLQETAQRTTLGLRTTRPRVYVVTSLTGGTGSGMFLDLAALLRRELRQMGYPRAELVAVLLAPMANRKSEARDVANSFAALRELQRLADNSKTDKAGKAADKGGTFDRCVLLSLPSKAEGAEALQEMFSLAGDFLGRELITPLGRVADEGRNAAGQSGSGLTCQTFGAFWFSVPRRPLLQRVAQHLCQRLVNGWGIHDPKAQAAAIKTWVIDGLTQTKLNSEALCVRLQEACESSLGQPPQDRFAALMQSWTKGAPGDLGKGADAVRKAMEELEQLLGSAQGEPDLSATSQVMTALREGGHAVTEPATRQLSELVMGALSEPQFRLAGTEDAAQVQLGVALDESARGHRRRSEELRQQAYELWQQVAPVMAELQAGGLFRGRAKARAADAIRELLSQYLGARWDCLVAQSASRLFQELVVNLHKYRRTFGCCHKRIGQFLNTFAAPDAAPVDLGLGRYLLPFGCRTLEEAGARVLGSLPPDDEGVLHDNVWNLLHASLKEHVHVCTAPGALLREMREQIDRAVDKLAEVSLGRAHAAEVYLERQAECPDADADLASAFDKAQPELGHGAGAADGELNILAVPTGPEGDRFRALVKHALPDVPMRSATSTDDIVFYRERSFASLDRLPQLGPAAREQYQQFRDTAPFGPHSRSDIAW